MPLLQGEVPLLTLYADCHYYFSSPNAKPVHHRFDRKSYVYLYHDALNRRGRIEIANHAGTPDQDAFHGHLDTADIEYSYKQPTLFTITVQGRILSNATQGSNAQEDMAQWHLPAPDIQNNGKYMYRLHALDIYLWTSDDAGLFLDSLKRVTAPGQVRVLDANIIHPEHRDSMSPVVQQLENVAIASPVFPPQQLHPQQNLSQQAPRNESTSSNPHVTNFAASPMTTMTPVSPPTSPPVDHQQQGQPAVFAPMAYNPAAPAAPEPIAHREKTPPPPDAASGTGLGAAAPHDHPVAYQQQYGNPLQQQFSPQPSGGPYTPGLSSVSAPQPGVQRTNTFGQPAQLSQSPFNPSFAAPPTDPNAHLYSQQQQQQQQQHTPAPSMNRQNTHPPSFGPGAASTTTPSFGPGAPLTPSFGPGAPPQQFGQNVPQSPGFPPSGHSQTFSPSPVQQSHSPAPYGHSQPHGGYTGINNPMHSQVYIPEGGAQHGASSAAQGPSVQQQNSNQALAAMGKLDKGISKFLKKLDKKY